MDGKMTWNDKSLKRGGRGLLVGTIQFQSKPVTTARSSYWIPKG